MNDDTMDTPAADAEAPAAEFASSQAMENAALAGAAAIQRLVAESAQARGTAPSNHRAGRATREVRGSVYADKTISCRDCGMDFVFSAGEQQFYAEKGLVNEPQRCPSCRAVAKQNRALGISSGGGSGQRELRHRGLG